MPESTPLPDQLAAETMRQLLHAMLTMPDDTPLAVRLKYIAEASSLLARTETKTTVVSRLGATPAQAGA